MSSTKTYYRYSIEFIRVLLLSTLVFLYILQPFSLYIYEPLSDYTELYELEGEEDFGEEESEDYTNEWQRADNFSKRKIITISNSVLSEILIRDKFNAYKEFLSEIPVPPPRGLT